MLRKVRHVASLRPKKNPKTHTRRGPKSSSSSPNPSIPGLPAALFGGPFASRNPNRFPRSSPQKRSLLRNLSWSLLWNRRSRYGGMPPRPKNRFRIRTPGNRMPDSRLLQSLPPGRQPPGSRNTPSPRSPNPLRPSLYSLPSPNPNLRLRCSGTKTRPPCAIATSSVSSGRSMIRRLPHPLQLRRRNRKPRRNRLLSRLHPSRNRRLPNPNRLFLPRSRNRCKQGPKPKSCCSTL